MPRMAEWVELEYSKSQVKRAGKTLRRSRLEPLTVPEDEVEEALKVLENWRAAHSYALNSAQMGLRSRMATVDAPGDVSQRLKRRATIIDKLCRIPTMQLSTMHDIAGCRGVVEGLEEVRRLRDQWLKTHGHVVGVYDYIQEPQDSGYRGIHVVVRYRGYKSDSPDHLVEVQLRTRLQHAWAVAVEDLGARLGQGLKFGRGDRLVLGFFQDVAEAMAYTDADEPVPTDLRERIRDREEAVRGMVDPSLGENL